MLYLLDEAFLGRFYFILLGFARFFYRKVRSVKCRTLRGNAAKISFPRFYISVNIMFCCLFCWPAHTTAFFSWLYYIRFFYQTAASSQAVPLVM